MRACSMSILPSLKSSCPTKIENENVPNFAKYEKSREREKSQIQKLAYLLETVDSEVFGAGVASGVRGEMKVVVLNVDGGGVDQ